MAVKRRQASLRKVVPQRVLIVGVRHDRMTRRQMERSLEELSRLIDTAGGIVVGRAAQEVKRPEPATYLGSGKVAELAEAAGGCEADLVVVDCELSPVQNRNLEEKVKRLVLDRTAVILDIFAQRARSSEGKLQVELAQLRYISPRLVGRGQMLSQQTGRIGTRGPGETALEVDRRRLRERITSLRRSLERVRSHRGLHRRRRDSVPVPLVSLVGYTNAGKSTLMNALTGAGVFVEDKLFATLDPTVRQLRLPSGRVVLLADTVGFISRLPHELIEAFKSTFEEVASAAVLLHVIDGSDEEAAVQARVVEGVLSELDLVGKPRLDLINKCDVPGFHFRGGPEALHLSALAGTGLEALLARLDDLLGEELEHCWLRLPPERGDILSGIYRLGRVHAVRYEEEGVLVECELAPKYRNKYRRYREAT